MGRRSGWLEQREFATVGTDQLEQELRVAMRRLPELGTLPRKTMQKRIIALEEALADRVGE
jgi:hypothetical protein